MPKIPNINEIANPYDPAEEGNYSLTIRDAEDTTSKAGDAMIVVVVEITAAEEADNEQYVGKQIRDYLVYGSTEPSNFTLHRLKQYAVAAGLDPTDFEATDLIGAELEGQIRVRPGNEEYPDPSNQVGRLFVDVD